jgi:hypothetical protein
MREVKALIKEYKKSVTYMQIVKFFSIIIVVSAIVIFKISTNQIKLKWLYGESSSEDAENNSNIYHPQLDNNINQDGFFKDLYNRLYGIRDYLITFTIFGIALIIMIKSNREWERQWSANIRTGGRPAQSHDEKIENIKNNENQKKPDLSVVNEDNEDCEEEST